MKKYIAVTAGAEGNHSTEPYHVLDAFYLYGQLDNRWKVEDRVNKKKGGAEFRADRGICSYVPDTGLPGCFTCRSSRVKNMQRTFGCRSRGRSPLPGTRGIYL